MKRTGRDRDGRVIILPLMTAEEHIVVQRESKARTTLLQSIPDDHVADFHYMDDARDIWNAVKARFGGNAESKKMRKSMLKQEFLEFRIGEAEGLHKGINADFETAKKDLLTKLDNLLVQTEKWRNSSKNLFRLIDSSMFVRTKVGLGFNNSIRENEVGWDDSAFSVFTTNSEDVEGRPIFHRFSKADSMKAVPPPLSGDYTSLSDHSDLDESQMYYGTKSSTSSDSKYVSNDFISCNDSDKSSEVNTNDFASSDSSVKSLEPKPNDSTSCASTSTKASGTHLIKDCDFYEKQMANNTVGIRVGSVHSRNKVHHKNQFVPQAVLLWTGKVNIPPTRPQPVPTSKLKVFAPVPTGRHNMPFLVPTDRGCFPSVSSGWWKRIDGQLLLSPQQVVLGKHIEKVYTGYPRIIEDLIHLHTDDNVADLLTKALDGSRVFHSPMLYLLRVEMVINSLWIMPVLGTKELASPE
uniref:Xylulose kinase-1 n=1 Tax=Tanacetum cinerariifolium TaxID=118510 RepID=A0A6L2KKC6_TANCI|nr:xylulose kinase-1 [Tanacetum cinerariifolium]